MVARRNMLRWLATGFIVAGVLLAASTVAAEERPDIAEFLAGGQFVPAAEALSKFSASESKDDLARFQLGGVQFFAAIERLAQDSYRYGLQPNMGFVPFLRTPIKPNAQPEAVRYNDVRQMIERFVKQVELAEATLKPISDANLKWELDITKVRLDMNGDGEADADETLWTVFRQFAARNGRDVPESFVIGLDSADVHWLRGYCHLLAALGDFILAYDEERLFDRTAQLFFANPQTPFIEVLKGRTSERATSPFDEQMIMDAIGVIHLANFPLREPERLTKAREHLLAMIESSRASWKLIEAEADNDREWIPGPNQQSVVEGVAMTPERLAAWRKFLDEAEDVLNGKKLIPFWRGSSAKGVNLQKVFTDPRDFDLVLWIQGSDAVPYLEEGTLTTPETWFEFQRVFQGNFVGMAIWIN